MASKNYRGCSALDMAKSFLTEFIKMRGRDITAKQFDRYYLVSTEEYPGCVKELKNVWREGSLNDQLKQLRTRGKQNFMEAIMNAFKFVNLLRTTTGIENYGYGRYPYFIDPVVFVSISDGVAIDEIPSTTKLEFRGRGELTKEAFRWDHRLYSVVIRMSAECPSFVPGRPEQDNDVIQKLCIGTGGFSFAINSHRQVTPCIETLVQQLQFMGVNVRFQCPNLTNPRLNGEADNAEARLRKKLEIRPLTKIIVRIVSGKPVTNHWPIPESFWHKRLEGNSIPPRTCHPVIVFGLDPAGTQMLTDFPFDKYELEACPVVDFLLDKFKEMKPDQCLHVFVHGSGRSDGYGKPFGFLKVMSTGTGVNLFLMPYNYPVLIQLIQDLKADPSARTNPDWRRRLDNYLESVPPYYLNALRKNLLKFKISGGLLDDQQSSGANTYPPSIIKMLNSLRPAAKEEFDRVSSIVGATQTLTAANGYLPQVAHLERRLHIMSLKHWKNDVEQPLPSSKKERRERRDPRAMNTEEELFKDPADAIDGPAFEKTLVQVHFSESRLKQPNLTTYRNPLVLRRSEISPHLPRMLMNISMLLRDSTIPLLQGGRAGINLNLNQTEELHTLPISQMGNYEEYIKAQQEMGWAPLRDVEPKAVRAHAFGNPFKTDKKLAIDEVGESPVDNSATRETRRDRKGQAGRPPKRKAGPLASNSLFMWRERRKSLSERSSVVSDLSYTSDLDGSDVQPSTSENGQHTPTNGFSESTKNGDSEKVTKTSVEVWGLEEENEDGDDEPVTKKAKSEEAKVTADLSYDDLRQKKILLAEIVRKPNNGLTVVNEIKAVSSGLSIRDNLELVEFSLRDSRRFKRKALTDELDKELTRLRKITKLTSLT